MFWCLIYSDSVASPFWMLMGTPSDDREEILRRLDEAQREHPNRWFKVQSVSAELYNAIVKSTVKAMR